MKKIEKIINDFANTPDLIVREIKKGFKTIYIIYLETVSSGDRVNNYILRNIANTVKRANNLKELIPAPNLKEITEPEIESYLCNGFTIILIGNNIYALETKADLDRSISPSDVELGLYSPKDSLVENYQKNIGLIKRRIKSKHLKTLEQKIGKYTDTNVGVLYIDDITKPALVNDCLAKLKDVNVEAILAAGDLKQFLIKENSNVFPSVKLTERPDTIVKALLAGKIVLMVDASPFALIIPAFFADFVNPTVDDYSVGINVNFLKILRLLCFLITIVTPATYIAVANFSPEMLPNELMLDIAHQRMGVPFPSIIESLIMLAVCEILRESDLRFPSNYGSAISILGALVLGEAAVAAGIASPIMIIIIAITFIASLMFNDIAMNSAIRTWRFIFLISAVFFGLYGMMLAFLFMLVNLCSYESFGMPYMYPIAPLDIPYLKETIFKSAKHHDKMRSKYLTDNLRKQR